MKAAERAGDRTEYIKKGCRGLKQLAAWLFAGLPDPHNDRFVYF